MIFQREKDIFHHLPMIVEDFGGSIYYLAFEMVFPSDVASMQLATCAFPPYIKIIFYTCK